MNKYKRLAKDTLVFAIGSFGSKVMLFLLVPFYTNCLTTEQYGISDLIFTVAQLLIPIISVSINTGVLRFGLAKGVKREDVFLGGILVLFIGSILCIALTPIFGLYKPISQWKWYLCIYVIVNSFNATFFSYLKVLGRNKLFAGVGIMQTLTLALCNILLLGFLKLGVEGYVLSSIISCVIAVLIQVFGAGLLKELKRSNLDCKLIKAMVVYSCPIIFNDLGWWLIHSTDKIMIEDMVSDSALGIYTVATKIPALINVIIAVFSQAWGVSAIIETENHSDTKYFSNVFSIYSAIAFGASIGLNTFIRFFMNIYVGDDFLSAGQYVPLLLVSASFSAISSYYGSIYGAYKKSFSTMVTTLIAAAVNIILNYIFIAVYGIWGAVIGTVAAYVVISSIRMIDSRRFVKIDISFVLYGTYAMLALVQAVAVSFDWNNYIISAIVIVVFVSISIINIQRLRRDRES